MIDKQIYERYIEDFIGNMEDYVKLTKLEPSSTRQGWLDILEEIDAFRGEMLSLLGEIK